MSEPMSSAEIEDVLSSIRRLVSEELRAVPTADEPVRPQILRPVAVAPVPVTPVADVAEQAAQADVAEVAPQPMPAAEKLLLTPALRVVAGVDIAAAAVDKPAATVDAPPTDMADDDAAPLSRRVSALGAAMDAQPGAGDGPADGIDEWINAAGPDEVPEAAFWAEDDSWDEPGKVEFVAFARDDSPAPRIIADLPAEPETAALDAAVSLPGAEAVGEPDAAAADADQVVADEVIAVAGDEPAAEAAVVEEVIVEAAAAAPAPDLDEADQAWAQGPEAGEAEEADDLYETILAEVQAADVDALAGQAAADWRRAHRPADDRAAPHDDWDDISAPQPGRVHRDTAVEVQVIGDPRVELDEAMLRDLVRDAIREELQGQLGERITRNIRKLVRAEIARALSLRDIG